MHPREGCLHDVRPLTLHSLRHTFATLSLESGKSVKWVAQQLGHRDAAMTLNVYAHALPDEEDDLSYLPGSGAGAGTAPGRHELVTSSSQVLERNGDPGAIRTRDPQLRRLVLYPAELPGHSLWWGVLDSVVGRTGLEPVTSAV